MSGEKATREELLAELNRIRRQIEEMDAQETGFSGTADQGAGEEPFRNGSSLDERLTPAGLSLLGKEPTETIDLSTLFTNDISDSGSFNITGDIWATTFGKVMQALPIPALLVEESGTISVANEAWSRIIPHYTAILGEPFVGLFPSRAAAEKAALLVSTVFADRKPRVAEAILSINGKKLWTRLTFRSIRIIDDRFILVLTEDLTPEKEQLQLTRKSRAALRVSEDRFRRIYDNAPLMIQTVDKKGTIRSVNAKWLRDMGYTDEEIIGKNIAEALAIESRPEAAPFIQTLWEHGELFDAPLQYVTKAGAILAVRIDAVVTEDPVSGPVGLCTVRDETHELMLEKQLREAQKMEAVATLAGGIAHDFRNLLQIILGYADLLLIREDKGSASVSGLRSIREAATRGAELVNQVLTFSRRVESNPRPMQINHLIEQTSELLERTIPKMIRIELRLSEDVKLVNADPTQLEQVILNLALNAKDAMPEGGELEFTTKNTYLGDDYCKAFPEIQPGQYVSLSVADTGQGMEQDLAEHIFEPFFTTKKPGEGTGLGLSTVFGIVKMHEGHITCTSAPGKGARFEVFLPAIEKELPSEAEITGQMLSFGTETILLVDDEELVRNWGEELLTQVGYSVLTASNGVEAVDIYKQRLKDISLVILDLIMPEMGGGKCVLELQKLNPNVKIIIASGHAIDTKTRDFLQEKVRGIVPKPFRVKELLGAVRRALDRP